MPPPAGVVLYVVMRTGRIGMLPLLRALAPFFIAERVAMAIICLVPSLSIWLPLLLNR